MHLKFDNTKDKCSHEHALDYAIHIYIYAVHAYRPTYCLQLSGNL